MKFDIDLFEQNNVFLSFDAILGEFKLYLNSIELYTFEINAFQMFTKRLLFGISSYIILMMIMNNKV